MPRSLRTTLAALGLATVFAVPTPARAIEIVLDPGAGTLHYVSETSLQFIGLFLENASLVGTTCDPPAVADCLGSGSYLDAGPLGLTGVIAGMRAGPQATDLFPATGTPLLLLQTDATDLSFEQVAGVFSTVVVDADGFEVSGSVTLSLVPEPGAAWLAGLVALAFAGFAARGRSAFVSE